MDYRIGIDVMTTETACLSSIWETDGAVEEYLAIHGRPEAYEALHPQEGAYYDSMITIDLSKVEPMAALPFHPAEAYPIRELMANPGDIFREVEKRAAEQFGGKAVSYTHLDVYKRQGPDTGPPPPAGHTAGGTAEKNRAVPAASPAPPRTGLPGPAGTAGRTAGR